MTIRGFGKLLPIHGAILELIGWRLSRAGGELAVDEAERLELMRDGHAELVRATGQDFGYDLRRWREFLLAGDDGHGYRHPYGFGTADRAVTAAVDNPDFLRLAALAAAGEADFAARRSQKNGGPTWTRSPRKTPRSPSTSAGAAASHARRTVARANTAAAPRENLPDERVASGVTKALHHRAAAVALLRRKARNAAYRMRLKRTLRSPVNTAAPQRSR